MSALEVLLSDEDIAILNAARKILNALQRTVPLTFSGGVIHEAAEVADDALFQVLNVTHNYGGQSMTESQLHNRAEAEMVAT